ncbi:hypothetical protein [Pseudonocardia sp. GCM10023141]|uniref:hypothetical protein n=1 Tax=Pseudonocardia sp. GCM10023141 TaxID=3252653 RepID=UPI00361914F2
MTSNWLDTFFATLDAIPAWQLYTVVGLMLVLETTALIGLITPGEVVLLAPATTVAGPAPAPSCGDWSTSGWAVRRRRRCGTRPSSSARRSPVRSCS